MKISTWGASDIGQARKVNEDNFLLATDLGLVAVADGMGGFQRGDVASQLACNVIKETVAAHRHVVELYRRSPSDSTRGAVRAMLETALLRACEEVFQAAQAIAGEGARMGTTMDAMLMVGTTAFIAHVGDGRIYLQRGSEIHQITEDHSLVQEKIRDGSLSVEAARKAKFKNVITRALGVYPSVQVDTLHFELDPGDRLLLCSDGLYRYAGMREIGYILSGDVQEDTVSRIVAMANERGGRDNITGVVVRIDEREERSAAPPVRERMEALRKVDLFQYCTYRELMNICARCEEREVGAGELLFREGDIGRECFFIASGAVAIDKAGTQLAVLEPGDYFGEMSFLDMPQRSADARTTERSTLLVMSRDRFVQLMKEDSELAVKLMWQLLTKLSRMVRTSNDKVVAELIEVDALSAPISEVEVEIDGL